MKNIARLFCLSLLSLFVLVTGAQLASAAWSIADMNRQIDQTNFVVNSGCSGTLIDIKNRLVLTASHCVDAQYKTITKEEIAEDGTITKREVRAMVPGTVRQIAFKDANQVSEVSYRTKLLKVDTKVDLALLQIIADIPNTQASKISCVAAGRGDPVSIVGNPFSVLYSSVVQGIVSSTQRSYETINMGGADPLLQISGGVIGGNSGGAAYNANGELIGVPVMSAGAIETVGLAVPLSSIKDFLKGTDAAVVCPTEKQ